MNIQKTHLTTRIFSDVKRVVAGEIIDLDEDGNHDIVVSSSFGSKLTVLWGDGTGKFTNKSDVVPKPFNHVDINIGDIDADGKKNHNFGFYSRKETVRENQIY